jgi:hypothetical protein
MARTHPAIGEYLLQRLHAAGIEHVFGVPGDYVLRFYDALVVVRCAISEPPAKIPARSPPIAMPGYEVSAPWPRGWHRARPQSGRAQLPACSRTGTLSSRPDRQMRSVTRSPTWY